MYILDKDFLISHFMISCSVILKRLQNNNFFRKFCRNLQIHHYYLKKTHNFNFKHRNLRKGGHKCKEQKETWLILMYCIMEENMLFN